MKRFIIAAVIAGLLGAGCSTYNPDPADPESGYHMVYYDPYNGLIVDINCGMVHGSWNYNDCWIEIREVETPPDD